MSMDNAAEQYDLITVL
jgi:hypothetical protein